MECRSFMTTTVVAATVLGGFLTAAPAHAAPSTGPNCTVRVQHLTVTVYPSRRIAMTAADWDISCRRATRLTAELRVTAPQRVQGPVKGTFGTRFTGRSWTAGRVDPANPMLTAVLTFREGANVIGQVLRTCAKGPEGTSSCSMGRSDDIPQFADVELPNELDIVF
jgi:hypothetical protein